MKTFNELINTINKKVQFVPLWSVTAWDKKFNAVDRNKQKVVLDYYYFLAGDLKPLICEDGDVKILTTSPSNLYTKTEYVEGKFADREIVAIPWGGNPNVQYYNGRFVTADNRIATSLDKSVLDVKFLYYYLKSQLDLISTFYRGSGIKHPDMKKVLDLLIPLPSIEDQRTIVAFLDEITHSFEQINYTLLEKLELYQREYDMNYNSILNSGNIEKTVVLSTIVDFKNGKGHEKAIDSEGKYIVVNSKFVSTEGLVKKYTNDQICPVYKDDILIVMSDLPNGKALAKCFLVDENDKYSLNQRIGCLSNKSDKLLTEFLYFIINRNPQYLKYDNKIDQTNLKKEEVLGIEIPIISFNEQKIIVDKLKKLSAMQKELEESMLKKIEYREKQYDLCLEATMAFEREE